MFLDSGFNEIRGKLTCLPQDISLFLKPLAQPCQLQSQKKLMNGGQRR